MLHKKWLEAQPAEKAEVSPLDAVLGYLKRRSPIRTAEEDRIRYIANLGPDFHCKFVKDVDLRPETRRKVNNP